MVFDSMEAAREVRLEFGRMEREHLVDMEDCVVVSKDGRGRVRLDQTVHLAASGALSGGFWGLLTGLIFSIPLGGALVPVVASVFGAGVGALSAALTDHGIDDDMMRELGEGLDAGKAALFVLVRHASLDEVLAHLDRFEGKVLTTSFPRELDEKLRAVLAGAEGDQK